MAFIQCIYIFIHRDPGQNNDLFRSGFLYYHSKRVSSSFKMFGFVISPKNTLENENCFNLRHSQFALSVRFLLSKAGCRSKINRIIGYILLGIMPAELHKLNGSGV